MLELSDEMAGLWAALHAPASGSGGRVVQFVAARSGEGTSTVALSFAEYAARRAGKRVWLVDMDLFVAAQHTLIAADPGRFGPLGDSVSACPGEAAFFTVRPPQQMADGALVPDRRYLEARSVGPDRRWWVTRFKSEALRGRQRVHLTQDGDYWTALRPHTDLIVVDCPALERSNAALTLARFMDQSILVMAADRAGLRATGDLSGALTRAGGRWAGLFLNRVTAQTPPLLQRLAL